MRCVQMRDTRSWPLHARRITVAIGLVGWLASGASMAGAAGEPSPGAASVAWLETSSQSHSSPVPDPTAGGNPRPAVDDVSEAGANAIVSGIRFIPPVYTTSDPNRSRVLLRGPHLLFNDGTAQPLKSTSRTGGALTPLVESLGTPRWVVVHGDEAFASSGCTIFKVSVDGSTTTVLARTAECAPEVNIAVDDTSVYVATFVASPNTWTIWRVPINGDPPTVLVSTEKELRAIATDGTSVYWLEDRYPDPNPGGSQSSVRKVPVTGGPPVDLATGLKAFRGGLALRGTELFFADTNHFNTYRLMKMPAGGGSVTVLASVASGDFPTDLAVDDARLYWTIKGAVKAVPIGGGPVETLVTDLGSPAALAVGSGELFWTETACCSIHQNGFVKKISLAGGSVTTLAQARDWPGDLAVDALHLYWVEGGDYYGPIEGYGRLLKLPLTGGDPAPLADSGAGPLPVFASDGTHVYFANKWTIKKVPIEGGPVEQLAVGGFYVEDMVTDGLFVYWIQGPGSAILKVSVDGGPVSVVADGGSGPPGPLALDSTYVYWIDHWDTIRRAPKGGGAVVTLATGLPFLSGITVDGANIFFSEQDTGSIQKMPVDGGDIVTLMTTDPFSWIMLAFDQQYIFTIDQGQVWRVPKAGGARGLIAEELASEVGFPNGIATDGRGGVYWTETGGGTISAQFGPAPVVALSVNDVTVTEGDTGTVNANFTVTLSLSALDAVTVQYQTADGSATSGSDYDSASGTLTFLPGETTKSVTVVVNGDTACEPSETFLIQLSGATGEATIGDGQGQGTITNDETGCILTCPATVRPGDSFTATVFAGNSATDWVALFAQGAQNTPLPSNWRYVPLPRPNMQSFMAPTTVGSYELRLFANDTYTLIGKCTFQVVASPALKINDVTVNEGNAGTTNANFTVTLSPTSSVTVTVNWQTANGTATEPSDYSMGSGSLTFGPGESTKTVTVMVNADTVSEPNETFLVSLSGASGAPISDSQGQGTIVDDDAPPVVTCPATVNPGASFTATVTGGSSARDWIAMYAQGAPNSPVPPNWRYVPLPRPNNQTFTASMTPGSYELRLFQNESYTLLGKCPFQVAVVPLLSINDGSVTEGNAGTVNANFTVTLSPTAGGTVTVNFATASNTAMSPSDYASNTGTLTFLAGEATKGVTVQVNGDTTQEPSETFFVNLSGATGGAAIGDGQGQGTILDDDAPPVVTCPATVNPGASFTATVTGGSSALDWIAMYAQGAPNSPVPPNWRYVPLPRPNNQTFTASMTPGSYELRLFQNDSYTLFGKCPFQVAVVPLLSINDASVTEGNAGTVNANFTVTLSPTAGGTVTVNFATASNTAMSPSDYASNTGTLTFLAGEATKDVTVQVNGDTTQEPSETFFVNLSGATGGAAIGDGQGQGTIVDDDAPPVVTCPATVNPGASFTATVTGGSSALDWIAMYAQGAPNSPVPPNWRYVPLPRPNNQTFTASMTPGSYELRLFQNDSYTVLGKCPFQVAVVPLLSRLSFTTSYSAVVSGR